MLIDLPCPECHGVREHDFEGVEAACHSCGEVRLVEPDLIAAAVIDMEPCDRCRATLPVGHDCDRDDTPCLSRTSLGPCGICSVCLDAQVHALAGRDVEFARDPYGSPSDLDIP